MNKEDVRVLIRLTIGVLLVDIIFILAAIGIFTLAPASLFKTIFSIVYCALIPVCLWGPNKNWIGGWQNYFKDKKDKENK